MRLTWLILHGVQRHRCAPEAECPYLVIVRPHAGHLGVFIPPTMKQSTSMWLFPYQQAEKSLQNQHVLSILQVGSHQLQYRFFRINNPKSRHKTNTFCPLTLGSPLADQSSGRPLMPTDRLPSGEPHHALQSDPRPRTTTRNSENATLDTSRLGRDFLYPK